MALDREIRYVVDGIGTNSSGSSSISSKNDQDYSYDNYLSIDNTTDDYLERKNRDEKIMEYEEEINDYMASISQINKKMDQIGEEIKKLVSLNRNYRAILNHLENAKSDYKNGGYIDSHISFHEDEMNEMIHIVNDDQTKVNTAIDGLNDEKDALNSKKTRCYNSINYLESEIEALKEIIL